MKTYNFYLNGVTSSEIYHLILLFSCSSMVKIWKTLHFVM